MTESMIVEAVRSMATATSSTQLAGATNAVSGAADPSAVARFQAAMGVQETDAVDPIPFVYHASAAWRSAHVNNQDILHRIRALTKLDGMHGPSAPEMVELQYEVANLAFQQEIVTKVADKSSTAIQTLIKNQ